MHLLEINKENYIGQADPFIFEANGKFYIYTTGSDGIYAYFADDLFGKWNFYGRVFTYEGKGVHDFWAPSVIEIDGTYYLYCSFEFFDDEPDQGGHHQAMHVSSSKSPLGPFENAKQLLHPFSIDSHVVKNENGLFIFYSTNTFEGERPGTYIVCDRLLTPEKAEGKPVTMLTPTLDEDIYMRDRYKRAKIGTQSRVLSILKRAIGSILCIRAIAIYSLLIISDMQGQRRTKPTLLRLSLKNIPTKTHIILL